MKSRSNKHPKGSFIGFFRKIKAKRLLVVAYILVPVLCLSVGFAAWIITSPLQGQSVTGHFVSEDVINTGACIEVYKFTQFQMYYTGFVDDSGKITNTANIQSLTKIDFSNCVREAKIQTPTDDNPVTLYLQYTLSFKSGNNETTAFYTVVPTISLTNEVSTNTNMSFNKDSNEIALELTQTEATSSSCIATYKIVLPTGFIKWVNEQETPTEYLGTVYFNFTFDFSKNPTTKPADFNLATAYNQLYERFNTTDDQFLIDVRLSDVNPNGASQQATN